MQRIQTRELVPDQPTAIDDWQATEVSFTTVRPLPPEPLAGAGKSLMLTGGVRVQGHPALRAIARLSTEPLATRYLGNITLPRLLSEDPEVCVPLTFTPTRGSGPGLSVLELTEANEPWVVTPGAPLRISAPLVLEANEHVVPVAFDGEFFLPLGRVESRASGETVIVLDNVPPPLSDSRSLGGAIQVYFEKVTSAGPAHGAAQPCLASPVADDGPDETDPERVRSLVARARRVLVHVPGIVGDRNELVSAIRGSGALFWKRAEWVAARDDLILTFRYDPLTLRVADAATALRRCLSEVGLGPKHDKLLHMIAHSSGGLVVRWLIEREGGNTQVRKLLLLGTPNLGWPWPTLRDWSTQILGIALNQLAELSWPGRVLGDLAAVIDADTESLRELASGSDLIAELAASPDPGVPYKVLAGTISVLSVALEPDLSRARSSVLARLLERCSSGPAGAPAATALLRGLPNDLVSDASTAGQSFQRRWPPADVRWVACDHLTYFSTASALQALADALVEES